MELLVPKFSILYLLAFSLVVGFGIYKAFIQKKRKD